MEVASYIIDRITITGLETANLTLLIRVTVVYNDVIHYPRAAWRSAVRESTCNGECGGKECNCESVGEVGSIY